MTARLVVSARVGRLSWAWRLPAAAGLVVFYLACLALDTIQTTCRRLHRRVRHGR